MYSSDSIPFNSNYTNTTNTEIKLKQTEDRIKDFDNQYGLYFIVNKLTLNKSNKPLKLQAYCRNGDNKLSPRKTYKLS